MGWSENNTIMVSIVMGIITIIYTSNGGCEFICGWKNDCNYAWFSRCNRCKFRPLSKMDMESVACKLGGPELIVLDNNNLICVTREYNPGNANRTILSKVTLSGDFEKLLTLPSGGNTSYAGMVLKDGILYNSYYVSHEGQTSIYTANRENGVCKSSIYLAKVWADRLN